MNTVETRETVLDRIRTRVAAGLRSDEGFVLLDVLIGIAVLALLLLTAIQSIGPMRQRSYQSSTQSDARQVATAIEAYVTDNASAGAPASISSTATELPDINLSSGNTVGWYVRGTQDVNTYIVCIQHSTSSTPDAASLYNSANGAIVATKRGAGCMTAPTAASVNTTATLKAYKTIPTT